MHRKYLFIDDERNIQDVYKDPNFWLWAVAKSSEQAIQNVEVYGMPEMISFDHDLGEEDTSIVFLKWLIENHFSEPIPEYYVHSANPVGKQNIVSLMETWKKVQKNQSP